MNLGNQIPQFFPSYQQTATYYDSLSFPYQFSVVPNHFYSYHPFQIPFITVSNISISPQGFKQQHLYQRPASDIEATQLKEELQLKPQTKIQFSFPKFTIQNAKQEGNQIAKQKKIKKNAESNLINNVFSYVSSQFKSHRVLQEVLKGEISKIKIFYIFANNIKKLNGKYLNKANIKEACEIIPKKPVHKMLSKSIKRLQILSIHELRIALRKVMLNYIRGSESILPLLTSKKMCKIVLKEYLNRRRELCKFLITMLED